MTDWKMIRTHNFYIEQYVKFYFRLLSPKSISRFYLKMKIKNVLHKLPLPNVLESSNQNIINTRPVNILFYIF